MSENFNQKPQSPQLLKKVEIPDGVRLHMAVPADLLYFEGHFSNVPVVPGVCQIKWVVEAIQQHFQHKLSISNMEAVKFFNLLFPGQEFDMELRQKNNKWLYHLTSMGKNIARGRIVEAVSQGTQEPA